MPPAALVTALPLAMPAPIRTLPIRLLPSAKRHLPAFEGSGIETLGDLARTPASMLASDDMLGTEGLALLRAEYAELAAAAPIALLRLPGPSRDLSRRDTILETLIGATDIRSEVHAALSYLPERKRSMLLQRWITEDGQRQTLGAVAAMHGCTAERIRQVVTREEYALRNQGVVLPLCNAVVLEVDASGGALPASDLIEQAAGLGIMADADLLHLISAASMAGLTEMELGFDPDYHLWVTPGGLDRWITSQRLGTLARGLRDRIRMSLERLGAIPLSVAEECAPWGIDHALKLADFPREDFKQVGKYLVPLRGGLSGVERVVLEMLAVSPELPLNEVLAGIGRMKELSEVPSRVLAEVVTHHPSFEVADERVRAAPGANPWHALTASRQAAFETIAAAEGDMTENEFVEAMSRRGYSERTALILLQRPFIVPNPDGTYRLRS